MINGVRVFDTILDSRNLKDTVGRNSADFWKPFCKSAGWKFSYERVHSLNDLEFFFNRKIKEDVIIFSGHGNEDGFHLSNGEVLDPDFFGRCKENAFTKKNHGKIIIFSTCLIGRNRALAADFKECFGAEMLFSYRHLMSDRFCFLNESVLLTMIEHCFDKKDRFTRDGDFKRFQDNTAFMKNMNEAYVKHHPMIMV